MVDLVKYEGARRALELKLGSLQLDVHDHSAGWRSALMIWKIFIREEKEEKMAGMMKCRDDDVDDDDDDDDDDCDDIDYDYSCVCLV